MLSARAFVERAYTVGQVRALRHQAGVFYGYDTALSVYVQRDEASVRAELYAFLDQARQVSESGAARAHPSVPFRPTKGKVENVLDALRAICNLPTSFAAPCWLTDAGTDAFDLLACRNGLLHIPTRTLLPATREFFTLNGVPFVYEPDAPPPERWLEFIGELWPEDQESRETLQEWIGHLLTPRTGFQKIGMLVGPKRSGKGTIARVIRRLLGERNVCGPTLASLGEPFGLGVLIGRSVAIVADARISGRTDSAVITERLLSIPARTRSAFLENSCRIGPAHCALGSSF